MTTVNSCCADLGQLGRILEQLARHESDRVEQGRGPNSWLTRATRELKLYASELARERVCVEHAANALEA